MTILTRFLKTKAAYETIIPRQRASRDQELPSEVKPFPVRYRFVLFSLIFWLILAAFINLVPPSGLIPQATFFVIAFFCVFSTVYIFRQKFKLSLLLASFFISLLLLIFLRLLSPINFTLLSGFFIAIHFLLLS